jgi:hypothetical protein
MQQVDSKSVQLFLAYKQSLAKLKHIGEEKEKLIQKMKDTEQTFIKTKVSVEIYGIYKKKRTKPLFYRKTLKPQRPIMRCK